MVASHTDGEVNLRLDSTRHAHDSRMSRFRSLPALDDSVLTRLRSTCCTFLSFPFIPCVLPGTSAGCTSIKALFLEQALLALFFLLTRELVFDLLGFDLFPKKALLLFLLLNWIDFLLVAYRFGSIVAGEYNLHGQRFQNQLAVVH